MCDALLEYTVGREADRVEEALGFEVFVHLRRGEGGIAPEIQPYLAILVANDNRLQSDSWIWRRSNRSPSLEPVGSILAAAMTIVSRWRKP